MLIIQNLGQLKTEAGHVILPAGGKIRIPQNQQGENFEKIFLLVFKFTIDISKLVNIIH